MIRRLLPLVGVFFVLLTPAQHVSAATGELNYTAYSWSSEPSAETQCASGNFTSLILEWDSEAIPGCPGDNFYLDITGQLYSPGPDILYALYSDDGVRVTIDGQLVTSNWWDRGCSGFLNDWQLSEGWHDIRIEFYENGGGTCLQLYQVTSNGWSEIPAAYFNAGERIAPAPSSTIAPMPEPTTTSIEATTTTSLELETTTTIYQPTESTNSPTTTSTIDTSNQISPTTPSTQPIIPPTVASTSEPTTIPMTTNVATTSSIPEKIAEQMSSDEALAVITDAAAVAELTAEQAAEVFAAIDESTITPEEAAAIVEAVQKAPPSIREQFEKKINIFAGIYDGYIPLGSLVPVRTRRIIIITTGLLVAAPTLRRK